MAEAVAKQPALLGGINVMDGKITQQAVAEALGMAYVDPKGLALV